MKILFTCLVVGWALLEVTSGRLIVRHKRQIEKEGEVPAAEVVVIKDTNGTFPPGPRYDFTPNSNDNDSVIDLDVNENDGTFNFGGHLPHIHDFHHFHRSFSEIFDAIQKRFEEMTRHMMAIDSSNFGPSCCSSFGSGLRPSTDVASIPDNTNNTVTEIVTFNGRRYLKKTTTIKKGGPGSTIFIRSTTFEPVDESENTDDAGSESSSPKPINTPDAPSVPLPGEPLESSESSQTGKRIKDTETAASPSLPETPSTSETGYSESSPPPKKDEREREEMTSPATS